MLIAAAEDRKILRCKKAVGYYFIGLNPIVVSHTECI